jgi:glycosyltransferase involved in cell wall biosynthesis
MSYGLPILYTRTCYFDEIAETGAGLVVEPTQDSIAEGLDGLLGMDDHGRVAMGRAGRDLVERKYSWASVAQQMIRVYEWVLGYREAPECVQMGAGGSTSAGT